MEVILAKRLDLQEMEINRDGLYALTGFLHTGVLLFGGFITENGLSGL